MRHRRTALAVTTSLALAACTQPADVSRPLTEAGDKNARIAVREVPSGIAVDVSYSRYQFVPDLGALITACRSLALSRARDEAKARSREIEPLGEGDVRVSTGRNIVNARSACRAHVDAKWKA